MQYTLHDLSKNCSITSIPGQTLLLFSALSSAFSCTPTFRPLSHPWHGGPLAICLNPPLPGTRILTCLSNTPCCHPLQTHAAWIHILPPFIPPKATPNLFWGICQCHANIMHNPLPSRPPPPLSSQIPHPVVPPRPTTLSPAILSHTTSPHTQSLYL